MPAGLLFRRDLRVYSTGAKQFLLFPDISLIEENDLSCRM